MDTLKEIIDITENNLNLWEKYSGIGPIEVHEILSNVRFDRIISLTEALEIWVSKELMTDGELILANTNLGSLVESWLKFFYVVHYWSNVKNLNYNQFKEGKKSKKRIEYEDRKVSIENNGSVQTEQKKELSELRAEMKEILKAPNDLQLDFLIHYSKDNLLLLVDIDNHDNEHIYNEKLYDWLRGIQKKRNSIHSFNSKEIGTTADFKKGLQSFLELLIEILDRVPPLEDLILDYSPENYY